MLLLCETISFQADFEFVGGLNWFLRLLASRFGKIVIFCFVYRIFDVKLVSFLRFDSERLSIWHPEFG